MIRFLRLMSLIVGLMLIILVCFTAWIKTETPSEGWIVFQSRNSGTGIYDLYRVLSIGSQEQQITSTQYSAQAPQWSPDGEWIMFRQQNLVPGMRELNRDLYRVRPDGSDLQRLTGYPTEEHSAFWSSDGEWITFAATDLETENRAGFIARMRSDGTDHERLADVVGIYGGGDWSPDGEWLTFVRQLHGQYELYQMRYDGTDIQHLSDYSDSKGWSNGANWSPDGEWLVFSSDYMGNYNIYRMRSDGSGVQALTSGASKADFPTWSPDGQWISYKSNYEGLFVMRSDGSQKRLLHEGIVYATDPWSPDSQSLVFSGIEGEIFRVNIDGSGLKQLTDSSDRADPMFGSPTNELPRWSPPIDLAWSWWKLGAISLSMILFWGESIIWRLQDAI